MPNDPQLKRGPDQKWYKKPYWRSFNQSFYSQLSSFKGASWSGTRDGQIGQLVCIYSGGNKNDFMVTLHFHSMVYMPKLQLTTQQVKLHQKQYWMLPNVSTADVGGFVVICKSPNPADCPFHPRIKKKPQNIYLEAEKIRQNAPSSD